MSKQTLIDRFEAHNVLVAEFNNNMQYFYKREMDNILKNVRECLNISYDWSGTDVETKCDHNMKILEAFIPHLEKVVYQEMISIG